MRGRQARRFAKLAVFVALAAFLPGCPPAPPPSVLNRAIDSLTDVIARINANNRLIPTLWARQSFDGYIRDDQGHTQYVSADSGVLLYYGPSSMRLVANNEFGSVFEVGINSRDYWAIVYPQLSTFWYGKTANIGKPCVRPIPVRPDLLINMLGLGQINPKLL
ncbi:MAG TPA: hypothetical protein VL992_09885, partial [Tepidisphaeraceae bacterium]|nr:hypothetical protein [Tepidisphaeraceae bacterium]